MRKRKKPDESPGSKRQSSAWGAGSPTVNRAAQARQKEAPDGHSGDFGKYMANKVRKLGEQFQADASTPKDGAENPASCLFTGVSIHVNGYTVPSHQDLRALMVKHGGSFHNYFSKARVTHIICSNLPASKINEFRAFSKGLPVVKPEWVVDSITAGKLLSWTKYQLELELLNSSNQKTLSSFYGVQSPSTPENICELSEAEKGEAGQQQTKDCVPGEVEDSDHLSEHGDWEEDGHVSDSAETNNEGEQNERVQNDERQHFFKHTTLGDVDFVKNYFKSSRLHFIGTWRNRYQANKNSRQENLKQKSATKQQAIIHVDMDCFFVAVVTRNRPELAGKPIAVCHSDSSRGTAEISSANYEARGFGVKAGMFVRNAKELCPTLETVPYDFEGYEQVAEQVYDILHRHSSLVQAVSCDEAFLDVSGMGDPAEIALAIREEIFASTKCTASAGISVNVLLSRLATKKAKPNGQYQIHPEQAQEFMAQLPVGDLPGVGSALRDKLHGLKLFTCSDICRFSMDGLRRNFGQKTGEMLWKYSHGLDDRNVQPSQVRKSIGAEVNWGVRFSTPSDAQRFLATLSEEVVTRLSKAAVHGRMLTMKVKKRKAGAGEPVKFMGCGVCDNISRSVTLPAATNKMDVILRVSRQLFGSLNLDVCEVRGVGLQVSKLEPLNDHSEASHGQNRLESWIAKSPIKKPTTNMILDKGKNIIVQEHTNAIPDNEKNAAVQEPNAIADKGKNLPVQEPVQSTQLPPASDIDPSFLASLPPELLAELNEAYNGALSSLKLPAMLENEASSSKEVPQDKSEKEFMRGSNVERSPERASHPFAMPTFSQLDQAVLAELPSELQREVIDSIPATTELEFWSGSPPAWVKLFQESKCSALQSLSNVYTLGDKPKKLSDALVNLLSASSQDYSEDSVVKCSRMVNQYFQAIVASDLEELHAISRLIRRLARRCMFWCQVQDHVIPEAQDQVFCSYNGRLEP